MGESQNKNEKQQGEGMARQGDYELRGQGLKIGKSGEACVNVPLTKCDPEGVAVPSRVPCPQTAWHGAQGAASPCTADQETSLEKPWFLQNVGGEEGATGGKRKICDCD